MRVLIADDQLRMATVLKRGLREDGHTVDVVLDGDDVLRHTAAFPYDAVVVDATLPGADAQLCRRLRERHRRMPVLMLTRRNAENDRVWGLDADADAYLIEPFSFEDLSAQLAAMTRRGSAMPADELRVGDLRMDLAAARVWRGQTELTLSGKEFALLRLFMAHPGRAMSREHIFGRLWDCAGHGSSNVVDQYVLYLRRKVDRPFAVHQIETVRGLGYRLRPEPTPRAESGVRSGRQALPEPADPRVGARSGVGV